MRKQFNFNNEVDVFEVEVAEDGRVTIPGPDGPMAEYTSMQQFAEIYAQARDVKPENLKNWTLVEHGDVVSFVLRAATAGVSADAIADTLDEIFTDMKSLGSFHPLAIARLQQELAGSEDIVNALAMSAEPDAARYVYDCLDAEDALVEPKTEPEVTPDTRSEIEQYLDYILERDGSLSFFARLLNLDNAATKEQLLSALETYTIPYTCEMLRTTYEGMLDAAMQGIHVDSRFDALLVMTQHIPMEPDSDAQTKIITATTMARREKVNVTTYTVGLHHIKKSAELMNLETFRNASIYMLDSVPVVIVFDSSVDAVLEAEAAANAGSMEEMNPYEEVADDEDDGEDYEEEDDYDDYYDDDDEF